MNQTLISKGLLAILEFFQKTNETIQSQYCQAKKPISYVRFLEELSDLYESCQQSGQTGKIWSALKMFAIWLLFRGMGVIFYGQKKGKNRVSVLKVRPKPVLALKCTFFGQNRLNIRNPLYLRKKNVHVCSTCYKSLVLPKYQRY